MLKIHLAPRDSGGNCRKCSSPGNGFTLDTFLLWSETRPLRSLSAPRPLKRSVALLHHSLGYSDGRSITPMANGPANSIKVLAVDGGGIRGIIPAVILGELQKRLSRELWQTFDLITGTSTRGIIALGLCTACNNAHASSPA